MASFVTPDAIAAYRGLGSMFEYTNGDGECTRTNCGQAAAATLLTFCGKFEPSEDKACHIMAAIERHHPPDNLGGLFGTSRRRVTQICRAFGVRVRPVEGESTLRAQLDLRRPVIVMLGVSAGKFWKWDLPGGHWMVAYGYDPDHVYLTNWGKMTWQEFRAGWNSLVPRLIAMRRRGLAAL